MTRRSLSTMLIEDGLGARLEMDAAELRVVVGPDRGLKRALEGHSLRIGTAPDCELQLHDRSVSARHAELTATAGGYVIRDLGSKNGIYLQSWRIERAPLADKMRLELGQTTIQVRSLGTRHSLLLGPPGTFHGLTAHAAKSRALATMLQDIARSDATVLIEGESGSGKEVVARALHGASPRRNGPFIVFDCGATNLGLAQSELFGHERGAFTGADRRRPGLLEEADGGVLFLDEVAELAPELQVMLLGVLERRRYRRVGGKEERSADARIVAATHRNLGAEVREGRFRHDLLYRLSVLRLQVPPLRERPEDVAPLSREFAREVGLGLTPELLGLLSSHAWPGNVRELRNTISRLAVQSRLQPEIGALLAEAEPAVAPMQQARQAASDEFERNYLERLLRCADGNVTKGAELAGISRQMLTRLLAKHGLRGRDRAG